MKKVIFVFLFFGFLAKAQDLSWGVVSNSGVSKNLTLINYDTYNSYSCGRANIINLALYLNYKIWGPINLKTELFTQTDNQPFVMQYNTKDWYYNINNGDSYYRPTYIVYNMDIKNRTIGLATILNFKLSNFDLYSGISFNLIKSTNLEVDYGLDVYSNQPSYLTPEFTSEEIFSANTDLANSYADSIYLIPSFLSPVQFPYQQLISPVFGFQYHLNAFNIGYRRSYGCHQLTVGYDIGRYRYE
ncbi:MAG: hypothetical protein FJ349_00160 [Sphingomonadales bacterium]|nr:hypothetical protein [Sphingomonadales bacterium]